MKKFERLVNKVGGFLDILINPFIPDPIGVEPAVVSNKFEGNIDIFLNRLKQGDSVVLGKETAYTNVHGDPMCNYGDLTGKVYVVLPGSKEKVTVSQVSQEEVGMGYSSELKTIMNKKYDDAKKLILDRGFKLVDIAVLK